MSTKREATAVTQAETEEAARALGDRVRSRRRELGLDQRALALVSGVSRTTVIAAETGKATLRLDVLLKISASLGLHVVLTPDHPHPR